MLDAKAVNDVLKAVDDLKGELVKITSDIVKIPSINPTYVGINREDVIGGESKVNAYFKPLLEGIGMKTELIEEEKERANLVGVLKGTGGGKSLIFNGHVDVVPPQPDAYWTETTPWSGEVSDGKVWGRGACDMKGGDAAAFIALKALLQAGYKPKGDVLLEYVVGEENMNTEAGVGAVIKRGYTADAAIVVEPSGPPGRLQLCPASPGVFYMTCTIKGKPVHASVRDELIRAGGAGAKVGVSSIDKAMVIYEGLNKLEQEWGQTKSHPVFTRPGHFCIYPGEISGGPNGAFVISEESRLAYSIWTAPQDDPEDVKKEIEEHIARVAQTDPWLRENPPKVEWLLFWPPFDVPVDAPICKSISAAYQMALGKPIDVYGFAAVDDGAFLNLAGIPAVTIGPGNLYVGHAPNEFVYIDELVDAAKIYALSILDWCGY